MRLAEVRPTKLRRFIKSFAGWDALLSQMDYALGRCWDKTEEFVTEAMDLYSWDVRAIKADYLPEYQKYGDSHWIAWVNGYNIDFTARQFHPYFAFPRVWRGGHGCKLVKMDVARKEDLGVPLFMSAWEYLPK